MSSGTPIPSSTASSKSNPFCCWCGFRIDGHGLKNALNGREIHTMCAMSLAMSAIRSYEDTLVPIHTKHDRPQIGWQVTPEGKDG